MLYVDKSKGAPEEVKQAIDEVKVRLAEKPGKPGETDYDRAGRVRQLLARHLVADQKGLCVYCTCRIRSRSVPQPQSTSVFDDPADYGELATVEHYVPRHPGDWYSAGGGKRPSPNELSLDYGNLLAVCQGNGLTCDKARGNKQLHVDPRKADDIATIYYMPEAGEEHSHDPVIEDDLNTVLNLNHDRLKRRRRAAKTAFYEKFGDLTENDDDVAFLQSCRDMLNDLKSDARPPSFAPMMMWILEQRISDMEEASQG